MQPVLHRRVGQGVDHRGWGWRGPRRSRRRGCCDALDLHGRDAVQVRGDRRLAGGRVFEVEGRRIRAGRDRQRERRRERPGRARREGAAQRTRRERQRRVER